MIWAASARARKTTLVILEVVKNGAAYFSALQQNLLQFAEDLPICWLFMPGGSPCHRARIVNKWLKDESVNGIWRPMYSPDLNRIENPWVILARRVYDYGRQFEFLESFMATLHQCWAEIRDQTHYSLVDSVLRRCKLIYEKDGEKIPQCTET